MKVLRGRPDGAGRRVAVVAGRYNEVVTSKLVEGALAGLAHHGVGSDDITVAWVPGAFEIRSSPSDSRAAAAPTR